MIPTIIGIQNERKISSIDIYINKPTTEDKWKLSSVQFILEASRLLNCTSIDPRDILGVSSDASYQEVRLAYRRIAGTVHPDKCGEPWKNVATQMMKMVNWAYECYKRESVK